MMYSEYMVRVFININLKQLFDINIWICEYAYIK